MKISRKNDLLQKRRWRIRKTIKGTQVRPRLSVHFSNKHICAQCINDETGTTLVSVSSMAKELHDQKLRANQASAVVLGKLIGEKARAAGIGALVFDRGGRRYHGCVKAFADAVRETGLQF